MVAPPQQPLPPAATSSTTTNDDAIVSTTPLALGGNSTMSDELILEILSRLPVKSLMRFKCVRKSWLYLIRKDKHFISLHCSQSSKSNTKKLLISSSPVGEGTSFFTLDLFETNTEYVTSFPSGYEYSYYLRSRYGLICYVYNYSVKIYNLCTREETPWLQSNMGKKHHGKNKVLLCGFGFDPVTETHKALFVWPKHHLDSCWDYDDVPVCEVLTVGENSWRRLEDVPTMKGVHRKPTYANGCLYWLVRPLSHSSAQGQGFVGNIIEFDLGREKFRVIRYPDSIINDRLLRNIEEYDAILEVDGHLGLLGVSSCDKESKLKKTKIWTLIEDENKKSSSSSSCSSRWIEESGELPFEIKWSYAYESIPGKDLIMLTNIHFEELPSIYFYDRKTKELNKFCSLWEIENKGEKEFYSSGDCEVTTLVESIYPIWTAKQHNQHEDLRRELQPLLI